jgi:hypothetical protein
MHAAFSSIMSDTTMQTNEERPDATGATTKSIVLFSDGTGNSRAKLFKTNVWRIDGHVRIYPLCVRQGKRPRPSSIRSVTKRRCAAPAPRIALCKPACVGDPCNASS